MAQSVVWEPEQGGQGRRVTQYGVPGSKMSEEHAGDSSGYLKWCWSRCLVRERKQ